MSWVDGVPKSSCRFSYLMLYEPLQDVLLVSEVSSEDDRNTTPEIHEGWEMGEGVLLRQLPVSDLDEADSELIGLVVDILQLEYEVGRGVTGLVEEGGDVAVSGDDAVQGVGIHLLKYAIDFTVRL